MSHRPPPECGTLDGVEDVASVELPDGRRIVVRHAGPDDAADLLALYGRLSNDDRWLRFFTVAAPSPSFVESWLSIAERGGLVLVAWAQGPGDERTLVAEAGYSLMADGDGELGITVDPAWRGWLGPWLLWVLLGEAAARGVLNLQAEVLLTNRRMLALMRHHHPAVVDRTQPDEVRLAISTTGGRPGWPAKHDQPRVLVEVGSGRWAGEAAVRAAGFDVRTCSGPHADGDCPVLQGGRCPLAADADAVVLLLPFDDPHTAALKVAHERSGVVLVVPDPATTPNEPTAILERLRRLLGLDAPARHHPAT